MAQRHGYVVGARRVEGRELLTVAFAANARDFDMEAGISLLANRGDLEGDALQSIVAAARRYLPPA